MSYRDYYPSLPAPFSQCEAGALLHNRGEHDLAITHLPPPPERKHKPMSNKAKRDNTNATSFRLDQVTLNQLEWLKQFSIHLSVPGVTQRMVISRAIEFYLDHVDDLRITFQCQPRHKEVIAEQKALIEAGEARKSAFHDGELPELLTESGRMLGYSDLVKGASKHKNPRLPGIRMDKQKRESVELILKDRSQQEADKAKEE